MELQDDIAEVVAKAHRFTVVQFLGRGRWQRVDAVSLEAARAAATAMYREGARPVGIYAVAFNVHGAALREVHVENFPA